MSLDLSLVLRQDKIEYGSRMNRMDPAVLGCPLRGAQVQGQPPDDNS